MLKILLRLLDIRIVMNKFKMNNSYELFKKKIIHKRWTLEVD